MVLDSLDPVPETIAVTSADKSDAPSFVASGIAEAYFTEGKRVRIVRCVRNDVSAHRGVSVASRQAEERETRSIPAVSSLDEVLLADRLLSGTRTTETLRRLISLGRDTSSLIIFDLGPLDADPIALAATRLVDGVIIAFRSNRRVSQADREMSPALQGVGAKVLGLVRTPDENVLARTQFRKTRQLQLEDALIEQFRSRSEAAI